MRLKRGQMETPFQIFLLLISHLFHLEFQRPQKSLRRCSDNKFCSQKSDILLWTNISHNFFHKWIYAIYIHFITLYSILINDSFVSFISPKTLDLKVGRWILGFETRLADKWNITEMVIAHSLTCVLFIYQRNKLTRFKATKANIKGKTANNL